MAAFDTTRPLAVGPTFGGRALNTVLRAFSTLVAWNDARETRDALQGLTDRELEDIGLVRGDIEDIAQSHRA